MEGETESTWETFANAPPELTILSDLALDPSRGFGDSFDLRRRIGPIYDILRHPQTRTPMTVAIYGDWGTGKTSAMRWLMSLLETWNAGGGREEGQVCVRPVWFDPWKFDSKEEVWRGLLAEVVIASLDGEASTVTNIRTAMKD